MYHYPFIQSIISDLNQYLNGPDGWKITSHFPICLIDKIGRDGVLEMVKGQTLENWHENMSTFVGTELKDIIVGAVFRGYSRKGSHKNRYDIDKKVNTLFRTIVNPEFEFTALQIADSNPLKISCIRKVRLVPYLLDKLESELATGALDRQWILNIARCEGLHKMLGIISSYRANSIDKGWREEKGTYLKPAKYITLAFGDDFSKNEISTIAGDVASSLRKRYNRDNTDGVLVSSDVASVYKTITDEDVDSCMAHEYIPKKRFKIYNDLECCKVAYMVDDDGVLIARALLWDNVTNETTGEVFSMMDRIYFRDSEVLAIMQNWAVQHGYWYKEDQALFVFDFVRPDDSTTYCNNLSIKTHKITPGMYEEVPYIDTFAFCDRGETDKLYSSINGWLPESDDDEDDMQGYIRMQTTGGKVQWICRSEYKCACCGDMIPLGDVIYEGNTRYCVQCYKKLFKPCDHCGALEYEPDLTTFTIGDEYNGYRDIRVCQDCQDRAYDDPKYFDRPLSRY